MGENCSLSCFPYPANYVPRNRPTVLPDTMADQQAMTPGGTTQPPPDDSEWQQPTDAELLEARTKMQDAGTQKEGAAAGACQETPTSTVHVS